MPIQPLSECDIRALGSSLVLFNARSVIKELIDNALDAHANNVSIEISANTIDVIQVKDNGSGIGGDDRNLLCKRGWTSKIRTIQDLEGLGGSSLGFRGEALASIAGLSNSVLVTTRIDGEQVGSASKFGPDGHLLSLSSASHPVGTTVRVQDFLRTIPVRQQTAVKSAARTLADIKKTLQAYAFARPNVRISFKVLKAKNDKYNWTYGPQSGSATLLNATAKIVGKEVAAQCEALLWKTVVGEELGRTHVVDAVVAKGNGDPVKVGNKGHFISIDGRPVSDSRGVFKDLMKLYKSYYRHWVLVTMSKDYTVDPFLCLDLRCPPGSYDVNIEPAKDEVLFVDTRDIRNLLEQFLKSVYGTLPETTEKEEPFHDRDISSICPIESFDLLLAKKEHQLIDRAKSAVSQTHGPGGFTKEIDSKSQAKAEDFPACASPEVPKVHDHTAPDIPLSARAKPYHNMYDFDNDELSTLELPLSAEEQTSVNEQDEADLRKVSVTNPWSIAKVNALVPSAMSPQPLRSDGSTNEQLMTPGSVSQVIHLAAKAHNKVSNKGTNLPSPARSNSSHAPAVYQNPGPPLRRRAVLPPSEDEEDEIEFTQESASAGSTHGHPTLLESWAKPRSPSSRLQSPEQASRTSNKEDWFKPHQDQGYTRTLCTQIEAPSTQLTDSVEEASHPFPLSETNQRPFISPFRTPKRPLTFHPPMKLAPTASPRSENRSPTRQPWQRSRTEAASPSLTYQFPPAPLSQSHTHPMASPPSLQPSPPQLSKPSMEASRRPNTELDEIMEFEYRKKAINTQRRKQAQLTNRYLNPGQLAQLQRESTASVQASEDTSAGRHESRKPTALRVDVEGEIEDSVCNSETPKNKKNSGAPPLSGQEPILALDSMQKPSPHQNRYQAAKAALSAPKPQISQSPAHHAIEDNTSPQHDTTITTDDPRVYLIHHRHASSTNSKSRHASSKSPTHKLKRTKTSKLPFETVPPKSATHSLSTRLVPPFPSTQRLIAKTKELARLDPYPAEGRNEFVVWNADGGDVLGWEEKIKALVRERYVAKVGSREVGMGTGAGMGMGMRREEVEEEVPANLQMRLAVALRAHCEAFA